MHEQAEEAYTTALELVTDTAPRAPIVASLHAERASARLRLKDYDAALKDCALAIYAQVQGPAALRNCHRRMHQ